jgi:hypothetical protein
MFSGIVQAMLGLGEQPAVQVRTFLQMNAHGSLALDQFLEMLKFL